MSNFLEIFTRGGSIVIRFAHPESRNALSTARLQDLDKVLTSLETRENTKRIVFTGKDTVFAAGADLKEIASLEGQRAREFAEYGQSLMQRISLLKQDTVAAVNGHCFGGALDLALACKRRFSTQTAMFCHPGAGLGIITGWGGTQRLPRLVGEANALQMFVTATPITALEALRIGLVDEIADDPLEFSLSR